MIVIVLVVLALLVLLYLTVAYLLVQRAFRAIWSRYIAGRVQYFDPVVLELLNDPSPLDPITRRLRPFDREIVERLLLQQANELEGQDRDNMTRVFEDAGYVDDLIARLNSRRWYKRLEAAAKLGIMRSQWSIQSLIQTCSDPSEEVRLTAVRSLGEMNDTSGLRIFFQAIEDSTHWAQDRVAEALLAVGPAAAAEVRAEIGMATRSESRRLYIQLAGLWRDLNAAEFIEGLLDDQDVGTRVEAIRALGSIGYVASLDSLLHALDEGDERLRSEVARTLGRLQDPQAVGPLEDREIPALNKRLRDPYLEVRYNAAWALSRMGRSGLDALIEATGSGHALAQGIADQVLAEYRLKVDSLRD